MNKTYYTIYKTTNNINGKFYIGSHKTQDINDDYIGSGKYLKRSIEKNGLDNFTKEILFIYNTPEEMYAMEAKIVNEDFLAEENTYNLKIGGFGGWDYINKNGVSNPSLGRAAADISLEKKWGSDWRKVLAKSAAAGHTKESRMLAGKNAHSTHKKRYGRSAFEGCEHSDATKKLIGEKSSIHQAGSGNSQFGTMWITNGSESKKIKKTDEIPSGFEKGRKIKTTNYRDNKT